MSVNVLNLEYRFEPGHDFDGVTLHLPLVLLNQFQAQDFDRLVPGLLQEKIEGLIRCLPRKLRKNFVPVNEFATACLQRDEGNINLQESIQRSLLAMTGVSVPFSEWQNPKLETHLQMHFALFDGKKCIEQAHDLNSLQSQFSDQAREQFDDQVQHNVSIARSGLCDWDFDQLPEFANIQQGKQAIRAYPALVDYADSTSIELFETRAEADFYHSSGIARLFYLQLGDSIKYLNKNLPQIGKTALMYSAMGSQGELLEDLLMAAIFRCFFDGKLPENKKQFSERLEQQRGDFITCANQMAEQAHAILAVRLRVRSELESSSIPKNHQDDMQTQLEGLVYAGFMREIDYRQLPRVPAYLQAMLKRLQNYKPASPRIDAQLETVQHYQQKYLLFYQSDNYDYKKIEALRWMIEEFRIACFAQPMKTRMPVSETKIDKLITEIQSGSHR